MTAGKTGWWHRFGVRLLLALTGIVIVLAAVWFWPEWDQEAFTAWKQSAGPVPFFTALAILPAIGFPTTPFYVLAGATFPPAVNLVGVALSLAANIVLCYLIARSGLRPVVEWCLHRTGRDLPQLEGQGALRFALLVKMAPGVATFLKNYIIALSGVRFPVYFAVCFSVTACYAAALVMLGESLATHDTARGAIAAAFFIVVCVVLFLVHRKLLGGNRNRR